MKGRILFENVQPAVDGGRWPAKTVAGRSLAISADVIRDGHDPLRVVARWRDPGSKQAVELPLTALGNDAFATKHAPVVLGRHTFTIAAWVDPFDIWTHRAATFTRDTPAPELELELAEAATHIKARLDRRGRANAPDRELLRDLLESLVGSDSSPFDRVQLAASAAVETAMNALHDPAREQVMRPHLEVIVDRAVAEKGAWYEFFPRSEGGLRAAEGRLPAIAAMGFDVVYVPPIHPIGETNRKGRNNAATAERDDVGSPWAIGSSAGGHTAVHPDLGSIDDFDHFVAAAHDVGLEIALDYALQCSPDHPWVTEHPEWFAQRVDGSIRYAENPPKKYHDIYPLDFGGVDAANMMDALVDILKFWIGHGVTIFRVDNPHTKPLQFWEKAIREVTRECPEVVFLSEAFTRPKLLKALAKAGFSQSYTYFTWRNTKDELTDFVEEIVEWNEDLSLRPNCFVNTQDILHEYLQVGGPPAFAVRALLGATLFPSYGIYSGFELFERTPIRPGSEEYLDSEKYQVRLRDWQQHPNLTPFLTRLNEIRRSSSAFDSVRDITLCDVDNPELFAYLRSSANADEHVLCVVNLNPCTWREGTLHVPTWLVPGTASGPYVVTDLVTADRFTWHGEWVYVRIDPDRAPGHILRFG